MRELDHNALEQAAASTHRFYRRHCMMDEIVEHAIRAYLDALDNPGNEIEDGAGDGM